MEKVIVEGVEGSVKIVQADGKLQLVAALDEVALIELGVAAIEKKYPAAAFVLEPLKAMIEAEAKKV